MLYTFVAGCFSWSSNNLIAFPLDIERDMDQCVTSATCSHLCAGPCNSDLYIVPGLYCACFLQKLTHSFLVLGLTCRTSLCLALLISMHASCLLEQVLACAVCLIVNVIHLMHN